MRHRRLDLQIRQIQETDSEWEEALVVAWLRILVIVAWFRIIVIVVVELWERPKVIEFNIEDIIRRAIVIRRVQV